MTDAERLHAIADFMDDYGFGRGDTNDGPHVRAAAAQLDLLRARLAEYSMGPKEADQWKAFGRAVLDALGTLSEDTSPTEDVAQVAALRSEAELYRRGYELIGACDISNFLALCKLAGDIGEPVLSDLWERMKIEKEYREANK